MAEPLKKLLNDLDTVETSKAKGTACFLRREDVKSGCIVTDFSLSTMAGLLTAPEADEWVAALQKAARGLTPAVSAGGEAGSGAAGTPGSANSLAAVGPAAPPPRAQPAKQPAARAASSASSRPTEAPPGQRSVFAFPGYKREITVKRGAGVERVELAPPVLYVKPVACRHAALGCRARFENAAGEAGHELHCKSRPAEPPGQGAPAQQTLQLHEQVTTGQLSAAESDDDDADYASGDDAQSDDDTDDDGAGGASLSRAPLRGPPPRALTLPSRHDRSGRF